MGCVAVTENNKINKHNLITSRSKRSYNIIGISLELDETLYVACHLLLRVQDIKDR
jgi:hypothetical protein